MKYTRLVVIVIGIFLPYLSRLPGGLEWLKQYTDAGILGFFLIELLNAITLGSVLAWSTVYSRPVYLLLPALAGFGYAAYWHYTLDLSSDANAAIALVIIPFYTLLPICVGGGVGYLLDRFLKNNDVI